MLQTVLSTGCTPRKLLAGRSLPTSVLDRNYTVCERVRVYDLYGSFDCGDLVRQASRFNCQHLHVRQAYISFPIHVTATHVADDGIEPASSMRDRSPLTTALVMLT